MCGSDGRHAGSPRQHDIDQGLIDFVMLQVKHVLALIEHALAFEQRAELANLLEESSGKPMLAVELVILDVRKYHMAQPQHLIECIALGIAWHQRPVLRSDAQTFS